MPRLRTILHGSLFALVIAAIASAQSDTMVIKGGTVHPKPSAPAVLADVLIEKGVIKSIAPGLVVPEGATVVDAAGKHVFPSMIDAFNTGLFEASSAAPGALGGADRVVDVYDAFAADRRRRLLAAGVGVVGLGSAMGRAPAAAIVSVGASGDKPSVILEDAVMPMVPASMTPAGAPGGAPGGPANRATAAGRTGISKLIDDALDGAKKYRESKEKYEKDFAEWKKKVEEWEKKKGSAESKPAAKDGDAASGTRRTPSGPPEGFRDWPREKQQEWIRENMRGGGGRRPAGGGETPAASGSSGGDKRPDPPEKPKREPAKEALLRVLSGDAPLWVEAHWVTEIEAVLDTAKEKKIRVVILGATEAPRIVDRLKAEKAMVALTDPTDASPDDLDVVLHREDLGAMLTKAGVPVVVTTAGGTRNGIDGLPFLVALHVGRGLSEDAAWAAVTVNAARALGLSSKLGSVEVGREAQLLVLSGPPLDPASKVARVVAGTVSVDMEAK